MQATTDTTTSDALDLLVTSCSILSESGGPAPSCWPVQAASMSSLAPTLGNAGKAKGSQGCQTRRHVDGADLPINGSSEMCHAATARSESRSAPTHPKIGLVNEECDDHKWEIKIHRSILQDEIAYNLQLNQGIAETMNLEAHGYCHPMYDRSIHAESIQYLIDLQARSIHRISERVHDLLLAQSHGGNTVGAAHVRAELEQCRSENALLHTQLRIARFDRDALHRLLMSNREKLRSARLKEGKFHSPTPEPENQEKERRHPVQDTGAVSLARRVKEFGDKQLS